MCQFSCEGGYQVWLYTGYTKKLPYQENQFNILLVLSEIQDFILYETCIDRCYMDSGASIKYGCKSKRWTKILE